jgi:uncharacterized phage infection (PIP) family protein YhgE
VPVIAAAAPAPVPPPGPDPDPTLPKVKAAVDEVTTAAAETQKATETLEASASELATAIAAHAHDDTTLARVAELKKNLEDAPAQLEAGAAKVEAAAKAAAAAAGASPSPDAAKLIDDAKALAQSARSAATATRDKAAATVKTAADFIKAETSDVALLIAAADAAIAAGHFTEARSNLDKAAKRVRESGSKNPSLEYSYAQLHDKMSAHTQDPAAKRKLLLQAKDAYQRFAKTGTGPRVQRANDRLTEIADELKELGPP